PALVDRARRLRRDVAGDAAREGELPEELSQPLLVEPAVRGELRVRPLEVGVGDDARSAVSRPRDVDRTEVAVADRAVQVRVDEVEPRRGAEVPEQPRLHVLRPERLAKQRVFEQVDLANGQVVRGAPVGVEQTKLLGSQWFFCRLQRGPRLLHSPPLPPTTGSTSPESWTARALHGRQALARATAAVPIRARSSLTAAHRRRAEGHPRASPPAAPIEPCRGPTGKSA